MTDLETLIVADEDARARLESVRTAQATRLESAKHEYQEKRRLAMKALADALERELTEIAAHAEEDARRREAARREWIASIEARTAALVDSAATLWVRIVEEGQVP